MALPHEVSDAVRAPRIPAVAQAVEEALVDDLIERRVGERQVQEIAPDCAALLLQPEPPVVLFAALDLVPVDGDPHHLALPVGCEGLSLWG